jgi:hypothetical protein
LAKLKERREAREDSKEFVKTVKEKAKAAGREAYEAKYIDATRVKYIQKAQEDASKQLQGSPVVSALKKIGKGMVANTQKPGFGNLGAALNAPAEILGPTQGTAAATPTKKKVDLDTPFF